MDKTIKVWENRMGVVGTVPLYTLYHDKPVTSLAYNPDGSRLASGSYDRTIRVWNTAHDFGTLLRSLTGHESHVKSVAYNHDGSRLVSGSQDNTVRLWNVVDDGGDLLQILEGHTKTVKSVVFDYGGSTVASAGEDDTIKVWKYVCPKEAKQCGPCPQGERYYCGGCKKCPPGTFQAMAGQTQCGVCQDEGTAPNADRTICALPVKHGAPVLHTLIQGIGAFGALFVICCIARSVSR